MGNQQAVVIGLCAGTDSCFVTDVNGCKDTVIALINNSNISSLSTSFSISSDPAPHVWDAYPTIIGGSSPYTYLWTWGDGTSDTALYSSHTYTSAANYNICLNVTDASGCSNTYCLNDSLYRTSGIVQINVINGSISISQTSGNNSKVIVYPNPANASIHIVVGNDQFTEIKIIDVLGKGVLYSTQPNIEVKSLQNGVYFLEVKTIEGILTKKIIVQH